MIHNKKKKTTLDGLLGTFPEMVAQGCCQVPHEEFFHGVQLIRMMSFVLTASVDMELLILRIRLHQDKIVHHRIWHKEHHMTQSG